MRITPVAMSVICTLFPFIAASGQEKPMDGRDAYILCASEIHAAPQDAYKPCMLYLELLPSDDQRRRQYVKTWLSKYEKIRPYIQFLQGLTSDESAPWIIYDPDLVIQLPPTFSVESQNKIQISRSFGDLTEEGMLRKAEAVYPAPRKMIAEAFRLPDEWVNESLSDMAPLWWTPGNDNIAQAETVTARAVRYYYDLAREAGKGSHSPDGYASLKYGAQIKHFDRYSHGKDVFDDVYVADLTLEWGFYCGGLCGMGFTRSKVVVLDSHGNVMAMYLDAPVNSTSWVS